MNLTERVSGVREDIARARKSHFRLVWIAGGCHALRTSLLRELGYAEQGVFVNLGMVLSGLLLDLPPHLRTAAIGESFAECIGGSNPGVACIDNPEILFEASLNINPISFLESASRRTTIAVAWPGVIDQGCLSYGPEDHPSSKRMAIAEFESIVHCL